MFTSQPADFKLSASKVESLSVTLLAIRWRMGLLVSKLAVCHHSY